VPFTGTAGDACTSDAISAATGSILHVWGLPEDKDDIDHLKFVCPNCVIVGYPKLPVYQSLGGRLISRLISLDLSQLQGGAEKHPSKPLYDTPAPGEKHGVLEGTVVSYDPTSGKHTLCFENDEDEPVKELCLDDIPPEAFRLRRSRYALRDPLNGTGKGFLNDDEDYFPSIPSTARQSRRKGSTLTIAQRRTVTTEILYQHVQKKSMVKLLKSNPLTGRHRTETAISPTSPWCRFQRVIQHRPGQHDDPRVIPINELLEPWAKWNVRDLLYDHTQSLLIILGFDQDPELDAGPEEEPQNGLREAKEHGKRVTPSPTALPLSFSASASASASAVSSASASASSSSNAGEAECSNHKYQWERVQGSAKNPWKRRKLTPDGQIDPTAPWTYCCEHRKKRESCSKCKDAARVTGSNTSATGASSSPQSESPSPQLHDPHFKIGQEVEVLYQKQDQWYPGKITAASDDGQHYNVDYADGDREQDVSFNLIRVRPIIAAHSLVWARLKGTMPWPAFLADVARPAWEILEQKKGRKESVEVFFLQMGSIVEVPGSNPPAFYRHYKAKSASLSPETVVPFKERNREV
jgi:hypothetical protein